MFAILNEYDVIWVSEMKSCSNPHLPGYKPFRNSVRYDNHGGISMYVKNCRVDFIKEVKFSKDDGLFDAAVEHISQDHLCHHRMKISKHLKNQSK